MFIVMCERYLGEPKEDWNKNKDSNKAAACPSLAFILHTFLFSFRNETFPDIPKKHPVQDKVNYQ